MTDSTRSCGLRSSEWCIIPGAQTERRGGAGRVRGVLGGKASPAAVIQTTLRQLLRLQLQHVLRLGAEAEKLLVPRRVLVHPLNGLVIPHASLVLLAELLLG